MIKKKRAEECFMKPEERKERERLKLIKQTMENFNEDSDEDVQAQTTKRSGSKLDRMKSTVGDNSSFKGMRSKSFLATQSSFVFPEEVK